MMRQLFAFTLLFVAVWAEDVPQSDIEKVRGGSKGLNADYPIFGPCESLPHQIPYLRDEVAKAKECTKDTDYRCFKACHFEKLGISDASGNVDEKKFEAHILLKLASYKDKKDVTAKYVASLKECLKEKVVLSKEKCADNEKFLHCLKEKHIEVCQPTMANKPPVPNQL